MNADECRKSGCVRRTFMDSERCFDHRRDTTAFRAYFALCLLVSLAAFGVGLWAVISLVMWVTSK